jgi:hypothetical protein
MAKSRAEMLALVGKLLADYAEFQRRRLDLPQGDLGDLSEEAPWSQERMNRWCSPSEAPHRPD